MSSETDIANSALVLMGAPLIINLNDDLKEARILKQRFPNVRDYVLRDHIWNIAVFHQILAEDTTAPIFGFGNRFLLPTDPYCLRVLSIRPDRFATEEREYQIVGNRFLETDETEIKLTYIGREEEVGNYDSQLVESIVYYLAATTAYAIVGSRALGNELMVQYNQTIAVARSIDASEGTAPSLQVEGRDAWTAARF